ncbi:MAG: hypothetical protein ACE5Q3_18660, partial [Alphaproteobacteria bacterium]
MRWIKGNDRLTCWFCKAVINLQREELLSLRNTQLNTCGHWLSRVEERRGGLGHTASLRFLSPLIEPDVRISR